MPLRKREDLPATIIGIDNGTRLVGTVTPGGRLTSAEVHPRQLKSKDPAVRCEEAHDWAYKLAWNAVMNHHRPVSAFLETPFISPLTMSAVIPLAQIQGAVMAGLVSGGVDKVYLVTPSQWKLRLMGKGNGNAKKEQITEWMRVNWPWLHQFVLAQLPKGMHQDGMDAGGVAMYGIEIMREAQRLRGE